MQFYLVLPPKLKKADLVLRSEEFVTLACEEGKLLRIMFSLNLLWVEANENLLEKLKDLSWIEEILPIKTLTGQDK